MSSDNPSGFLNFGDYMGLNAEATDAMQRRVGAQGDKLRDSALRAGDARYGAARSGSLKEYERTGEAARQGLAAYGDWAQGMVDPAARQALMEKTYGKGAVSAMDSAMMGNASSNARDFDQTQQQMNAQGTRADERYSVDTKLRGQQAEADKSFADSRQASYDKHQAMLKKRAQEDDDRRVDAFGRWRMGHNYNPLQAYGATNYMGEGELNKMTSPGQQTNDTNSRMRTRTLLKEHEKRTGRAWHSSSGKMRGAWDTSGDEGDDYGGAPLIKYPWDKK